MRYLLPLGVVFLCTACSDGPTAPSLVCTTEQQALTPVWQPVRGGYVLLDEGPLTSVTVCRRP